MRATRIVMAVLVALSLSFLYSCGGGSSSKDGGSSTGTQTSWTGTGEVRVTTTLTRIFDPKLDGNPEADFSFIVDQPGSYTGTVSVMSGTTTVRTLMSGAVTGGSGTLVKWDGKDDLARFVDPGEYSLTIEISGGVTFSGQWPVHVVRLAADRITFGEVGASQNFDLVYNRTSSSDKTNYTFTEDWILYSGSDPSTVDNSSGLPRPAPDPWPDPEGRFADYGSPTSLSHAVCYKMGSRVKAQIRLGSQAVSNVTAGPVGAHYPVSGFPIRIEGEFRSGDMASADAGSDDISPGSSYSLSSSGSLPSTVGMDNETVNIKFSFYNGTAWVDVPGYQETRHLVYRVADAPTDGALYQEEDSNSRMFVAALDWSCRWCELEGVTSKSEVNAAVFKHCWNFGEPVYEYEHNQTDGGSPAGFTLEYLLDHHSGRCGAWSRSYLAFVGYHGVVAQVYAVVNDNQQLSGQPNGYYNNVQTLFQVDVNLEGQGGSPDMADQFSDHALNLYNGKLFDPSYIHETGTAATGWGNLNSYENAGFTHYGFGTGYKWMDQPVVWVVALSGYSYSFVPNEVGETEVVSWTEDR